MRTYGNQNSSHRAQQKHSHRKTTSDGSGEMKRQSEERCARSMLAKRTHNIKALETLHIYRQHIQRDSKLFDINFDYLHIYGIWLCASQHNLFIFMMHPIKCTLPALMSNLYSVHFSLKWNFSLVACACAWAC